MEEKILLPKPHHPVTKSFIEKKNNKTVAIKYLNLAPVYTLE